MTTKTTPVLPDFQLASKTIELKDLHNSLMSLKFTSDKIADVKHMYFMIRQAIDIDYSTSLLLPDIELKSKVSDFFQHLVPKSLITSTAQSSVHTNWSRMPCSHSSSVLKLWHQLHPESYKPYLTSSAPWTASFTLVWFSTSFFPKSVDHH